MMKKKPFFCTFIIACLSLAFGIEKVNSTWEIGGEGSTEPNVAETTTPVSPTQSTPVCYSTSTSAYYSKIEAGLANTTSGGYCYVLPGTNPVVTSNCTIVKGATLYLPYSFDISNLVTSHKKEDDVYASGYNTSLAFQKESTYLKCRMYIADGVSLTNNGTIYIDGIVSGGSGGAKYNGHTASSYGEIYLNGTASIECYGTLQCYGYIRGDTNYNSKINFYSGSESHAPFIVREHRGGTVFLGWDRSSKNGTAFNRFFLSSFIDTNYSYEYGSSLYGLADLYASSKHNRTEVKLLGDSNSFLIQLQSGTSFEGIFKSSTLVNYINTYGSVSFNALSMSINVGLTTVNVSTNGMLFPLSWYFSITLNKYKNNSAATVNSKAQDIKMLPGSTLTISEDVTLTIKKLAVYDQSPNNYWTDANPTYSEGGTKYTLGNPYLYQADKINGVSVSNIPASLIINGNLNATSFGGFANTTQSTGSLSFETGSVSSGEMTGIDGKGTFLLKDYPSITYTTYSFNAHGNLLRDNNDVTLLSDGGPFISQGTYWNASNNVTGASMSPANGSSNPNTPYKVNLTATLSSTIGVTATSYSWSVSGDGGSFVSGDGGSSSNASGPTTTLSLTANSGSSDVTVTVTLTIIGSDGKSYTATGNFVRTKKAKEDSDGCVTSDTMVTLADGSETEVKNIAAGDELLVFNHETGLLDTSFVIFNDHDAFDNYKVIHLQFNNGKEVKVVSEHGFFDIDENEYVYIDEFNYSKYIGHRFFGIDGLSILQNAFVKQEYVELYSPVTAYTLNYFTEQMLSMPGGIPGLFNIFDYDNLSLKYDEQQKASDIATYGLFTYEDFADYLSEEAFYMFNGPYLKVAIGKGMLTWEQIEYYVNRYGRYF